MESEALTHAAPSTDSGSRLLNNGEQTTLAGTEGDWLQVILSDEQVAWSSV